MKGGRVFRRSLVLGIAVALTAAATIAVATNAFAAGMQAFPQGRYSSPLVAADFTRYGGHMDPGFPHPWTITMRQGRWQTNEHPSFGGRYVLHGNQITFVISHPADAAGTRETLRWTYSNQRLRFKVVAGVEGGDQAIYLAHPWRRIGP
jgi:hypothetical protein